MIHNQQGPLVSFIVPVYNGAEFIARCVESILKQPQAERCELILVNDGSSDNSLELLNEYQNYPGVLIIDKPNGGVSSARNRGLDAAKGTFISFVDVDDFLPPRVLDTWLMLMKDDVMLAVGESRTFSHDGEPLSEVTENDTQRCMSADKAISELLYHTPRHGLCDKFFRRDIVQQQQLRFREDIFNFEDLLFVISYLSAARHGQVVFSRRVVYHYVESRNSATRSDLKEKHFTYVRAFAGIKMLLLRPHERFYYFLFLKVTASHIYKALHSREFNAEFVKQYIDLYRQHYRAYCAAGVIPDAWSLYFTFFFLSPRLVSGLRHFAQNVLRARS
ncbi:glycosyltransferase [Pantoea ananatis]|uniref:glycosyltransferase family 2 protein n=1 Tax=Pantoea ananas TaxID=553 RepID=UPI00287E4F9D|nr:glycosyltransferase [Pantoea ananatis]MDS7719136.1 glycosyltransferase [Pantoea ananatis]